MRHPQHCGMRTSTPRTHAHSTLAVVCSLLVTPEELFPQVLMNCPGLGPLWSHTCHQGVAQLSQPSPGTPSRAPPLPHPMAPDSPAQCQSPPELPAQPRAASPQTQGWRILRIQALDLFLGNAPEKEQGALCHTMGRLRPSFRGPSWSAVVGRLFFHVLYNHRATGGARV